MKPESLEKRLRRIQPVADQVRSEDAETYRKIVASLSESERHELTSVILAIEKHGRFTDEEWISFRQALPSKQLVVVEKVKRLFQSMGYQY